jgi:hypothetical protein
LDLLLRGVWLFRLLLVVGGSHSLFTLDPAHFFGSAAFSTSGYTEE